MRAQFCSVTYGPLGSQDGIDRRCAIPRRSNADTQAKKWEATVGRPEIQKFAGALDGQRARKGIFITTSDFSREALDYVSRIEKKIILIDGAEFARLMIDYGVGVTSVVTFEVKRLDTDYFETS